MARQVMLHIVPGSGAYGSPLFGLHFYSWALIAFATIVLATAGMLLFDRQFRHDGPGKKPFEALSLGVLGLFGLVVLGNVASTVVECAGGLCPDDPTSYLLLP